MKSLHWKDRASLALYRNPVGYRLIGLRRALSAPLELVRRRSMARHLRRAEGLVVARAEGYRFLAADELPRLAAVVDQLRAMIKAYEAP